MGTLFFGIVGSLYIYNSGTDGYTHMMNIENNYLNMDLRTFLIDLVNLLYYNTANTNTSDPYLHILSFLSGSLFQTPELLHVFSGLIYGAIYFRCLMFIIEDIKFKKAATFVVLLTSIFLIYRGITGLNSIRWWTAFWLMFLGVLGYAKTMNKKFFILTILSLYVHFSFLVFIIPAFFSYFLKNKIKLVFLIWIASFFMGYSYNMIQPYLPNIEVIQEKESYTLNTEIVEKSQAARDKRATSTNFYAEYGETLYRDFSILLLTGLMFYFIFKIHNQKNVFFNYVFTSGVLLYALGNIMEFSPAVSNRGKSGASVILLASAIILIINNYNNIKISNPKFFKLGLNIFIISSIPMILFQVSYFLNMVSSFFIIFPFFSWFLGNDDFALKELLNLLM